MNRKTAYLLAAMAVWFLAASTARADDAHRTLKVHLNYTGAATVDEKHPIYVLLFDADPFAAPTVVDSTADATPPAPAEGVSHIFRRQSASRKDGTVIFQDLTVPTAYVMTFLDKQGSYHGSSEPPSGVPMGVYAKIPGKPDAIPLRTGKTKQVTLTFNDSNLTP